MQKIFHQRTAAAFQSCHLYKVNNNNNNKLTLCAFLLQSQFHLHLFYYFVSCLDYCFESRQIHRVKRDWGVVWCGVQRWRKGVVRFCDEAIIIKGLPGRVNVYGGVFNWVIWGG